MEGKTPAERHWQVLEEKRQVYPKVLWKSLEEGQWKGPVDLLTWGRGYACVLQEMDKPCGCPPGVCDHGMGDQRDPWYSTMGLFPPVRAMSQRNLNAKTERGPTGVTMTANPITWGQIKKTTQEAEKLLERQGQAKTPDSMFLAMLAVVSCASIGSGEPPTSN
nr:uncharacterized protein LOC105488055 [Macaca nemestrina]